MAELELFTYECIIQLPVWLQWRVWHARERQSQEVKKWLCHMEKALDEEFLFGRS